jgi:hypothetical protein
VRQSASDEQLVLLDASVAVPASEETRKGAAMSACGEASFAGDVLVPQPRPQRRTTICGAEGDRTPDLIHAMDQHTPTVTRPYDENGPDNQLITNLMSSLLLLLTANPAAEVPTRRASDPRRQDKP